MGEQRREIEFKVLLESQGQLDALRRAGLARSDGAPRTVVQTNHFFDTDAWDLRCAGHALRLRRTASGCTLTGKGPSSGGAVGTAVERAEEEVAIADHEADAILAGTLSPLALLEDRAARDSELCASLRRLTCERVLTWRGSFENERTVIAPYRVTVAGQPLELVLELDRTTLPGGEVHYELEVEVAREQVEAGRRALQALLDEVGVEWRPARGKAARFFAALEREAASGGAGQVPPSGEGHPARGDLGPRDR